MKTNPSFITKDEFVALLQESGITDPQMHAWHRLFEQRHPDQHDAFLRALGLDAAAVGEIRQRSR